MVSEFATRFCGSSDLYEWSNRRPHASVNFVTAHDGFTLNDLVSYNQKHNENNGEENRDGLNDNVSWNCGVEGPTDDPAINELREKKIRSFLATLIFSLGVPMIRGGDEIGHTQNGNNNAYCQDNEISWLDWNLTPRKQALLDFTRRAIEIYHAQPVLHRRRFFHGKAIHGVEAPEIAWLTPSGKEMSAEGWNEASVRCLGVQLFGKSIDIDEHGEILDGDTMLLLFNADHAKTVNFHLPPADLYNGPEQNHSWELILNTAKDPKVPRPIKKLFKLVPCSMAVFRSKSSVKKTI